MIKDSYVGAWLVMRKIHVPGDERAAYVPWDDPFNSEKEAVCRASSLIEEHARRGEADQQYVAIRVEANYMTELVTKPTVITKGQLR